MNTNLSLVNCYQENKDYLPVVDNLENKNSENLCKISSLFYYGLKEVKQYFKNMFEGKGDIKNYKITKNEVIETYNKFINRVLLSIEIAINNEINIYPIELIVKEKLREIEDINFTISIKECVNHYKNTFERILESVAEKEGVSILSHAFKINNEDIEKLKLSKKESKQKAFNFDCMYYAFYKLREPRTQNWVLEGGENPFSYKDLLITLKEFGYFSVDKPQKGDLIIYLNENRQPHHFGIFSDAHTVHSKWGELPQIISHPIDRSPFGKTYLIFRKGK